MQSREEEIGRTVDFLRDTSQGFSSPKMVVIGGYALRAHVPFARYSRDCDFALPTGLPTIRRWRPTDFTEESFEEVEGKGFMRWIKPVPGFAQGGRVGVDFMSGEIRGRDGEAFIVDERFLRAAEETSLTIAGKEHKVPVPAYADLLVMKVVSARKSDVRDVAAMVWANGVPDVAASLESLNDPRHFYDALQNQVLPDLRHRHFLDSWRGMFVTEKFGEKERAKVVAALESLVESIQR